MLPRRLPYDMVNQHPTERGKLVPNGESQPNQAVSESCFYQMRLHRPTELILSFLEGEMQKKL